MGTNLAITADWTFQDIRVAEVGPLNPTRGFSSFKFVPGTKVPLGPQPHLPPKPHLSPHPYITTQPSSHPTF